MDEKKETKFYLYFVAVSANIAAFCGGISFAWASPELPKLNGKVDSKANPLGSHINEEEESWMASLLMLGAAASPLVAGLFADRFGRKKTMTICMVPIMAAFLTFALANHVVYFHIARFVAGLGIGALITVLPMYIGEIAQNWNRGTLGCFMAALVTLGNLFTFCYGPYVSVKVFNLTTLIFPVLFLCLSFFLPESPYYYVGRNLEGQAYKSLQLIRYQKEIAGEIIDIRKNIEESRRATLNLSDLIKSRALARGLSIGFALMFFQQLSGINCVLSYMQTIFGATGTSLPSEISTMIVGLVQVVTCIATSLTVDKVGRRPLLLVSTVGSGVSLTFLALFFYLETNQFDVSSVFWLPTVMLISYIITYNLGLGALPSAMIGEMFPANVKGYATGATVCFALLLAFATTKFFPILVTRVGMAASFWLFAALCGLGFLYVWVFVPETKGKSLHDIQILLSR